MPNLPTEVRASEFHSFAEDMARRLEGRAMQAEELRQLPRETVAEAADAGFFGMLAPQKWGGSGGSFRDFLDVTRQLAHGCTSSAWTLSFLSLHAWLVCKMGPELQAELFDGPHMPLIPAPLAPTGHAHPVEGGYRISGRWEWATGIMHAGWVMVSCIEPGGMGPRFCVLPVSDVTIDDVWHVAGMAATGSNTVVANDVFVPGYRTLEGWRMALGQAPGDKIFAGTTVVYPLGPTLALTAATPALGAAEGALAFFKTRMSEKVQAYSGTKQSDLPSIHLRMGEAMATVRAARLVWEDAVSRLERIGPMGGAAPVTDRVSIRLAAADIVRLANRAIDIMAAAGGASSGFRSSPLQRQLRDVQMIRGHVVFDWDRAAQIAGRIELGQSPTPADML